MVNTLKKNSFGTHFAYKITKELFKRQRLGVKMKAENKSKENNKKKWETPRIDTISGLDSCVEFLYGTGGGGRDENYRGDQY